MKTNTKELTLSVTEKEVNPIVLQAKKLSVTDEKSKETAAEFLSKANKMLDSIVEYRESKTVPLNQALKVIRAETKPFEAVLETAIDDVRGKLGKYQTEMQRIADAEAAKIAARVKPGKGNLSFEKGSEKIDQIEKPTEVVATQSGLLKFKTVKKMKLRPLADFAHVEELVKLAKAGLIVWDEVATRKVAILEGKTVYGVEVYEEQVPQNYR